MEKQTLMQQVQEIGVESLRTTLRGILGKGPLVGFMLLTLVGIVWYFEREKKEWRHDLAEQKVSIRELEKGLLDCNLARIEQSLKIQSLEAQIIQIIAATTAKARKR